MIWAEGTAGVKALRQASIVCLVDEGENGR